MYLYLYFSLTSNTGMFVQKKKEVAAPPLKRRKKKLLLPGSRQTGPAQARSRSPPPPRRLPAMNGGLPGFRTPSSSLILIFPPSFSIRSGCRATASILPRSDLVLRRQCAGIEGRGRRLRALLRPLRLPRPLPRPRPFLPGKSPLRFCIK